MAALGALDQSQHRRQQRLSGQQCRLKRACQRQVVHRRLLGHFGSPFGKSHQQLRYRDDSPGASPFGAKGLPIRIDSGSSGAGWSDPKADLGGFNFRSVVDGYNDPPILLNQIKSWYGLSATTDVDASGAADINDAKFISWKGNRDATPGFDSMTGVPAYIDTTPAPCDALTGPESATCLRKPGTVTAPITVKKNVACTLTGTNSETDLSNGPRTWGGTCAPGTITCDHPGDPLCASVPDPVCAPPIGVTNWFYDWARWGCGWSGGSSVTYGACSLQNVSSASIPSCLLDATATTVTVPVCSMPQTPISVAACSLQGAATANVGSCAPAGGSVVTVAPCAPEPTGTVSVGLCAPTGGGTIPIAACGFVGRSTATVGACRWDGRHAKHVEGLGWYAYGGTCSEGGSTANCVASGGSQGGYDYTNNNGGNYFGSNDDAKNDPGGCGNIVAAGTVYNYGGSCQETGDASSCQVTGGGDATIGGTLYHNVNGSCSNNAASPVGTYTFGISCQENSSTASCSTSAGSDMTVRGVLYHGVGATCSNTVIAGVYSYGVTCKETGSAASCSTSGGSSVTIRGTMYTGIGATCSNTTAAGLYAYGITCQESGSANNCATSDGTTMTIRGTPYEHMGSTCSNTVTPGRYRIGGTCLENDSPLSCGTSAGTTMTIGGVLQTGVNRTCTQLMGVGSYLTGGTCSPGAPACSFNPGGIITIRGNDYTNYGDRKSVV